MLYGWSLDYLINRYSVRMIIDLHDIALRLKLELSGAEIKDKWTEQDRETARKDLYTPEENEAMKKALNK